MPGPLPDDTRGILDPARMGEVVTLRRHDPGPGLEGVVDWLWSVEWGLPDGLTHRQEVLNHPSANISIGTTDDEGASRERPRGRVYGPATTVSTRVLQGWGWTVAAKTTTGGMGALVTERVAGLVDRSLPLGLVLTDDDPGGLVAAVGGAATIDDRIRLLRTALERTLTRRDPSRVERARTVAAAARLAETDREVRRAEELAAAVGVGLRTLQRMFLEHAGLSPAWVIRRWRIIEAAERAGAGLPVSWPDLAVDLGYADQAHLTRDFRAHLGVTPAVYLARQKHRRA